MEPSLTYHQARSLRPCRDDFERVVKIMGGKNDWRKKPVTARMARDSGATLDDVIWAAEALAPHNGDVKRRMSLWAADVSTHVLHIFEEALPTDPRPREAILARRLRARGEIDYADWNAASEAAWAAGEEAWANMDLFWRDNYSTTHAARAAAWNVFKDVASDASSAVSFADYWKGLIVRDDQTAWTAERAWQFDRLVVRLSDPEPDDWPLPPLNHDRENHSRDVDPSRNHGEEETTWNHL